MTASSNAYLRPTGRGLLVILFSLQPIRILGTIGHEGRERAYLAVRSVTIATTNTPATMASKTATSIHQSPQRLCLRLLEPRWR
jgi:hypothetical protein